MPRRQGMIDEYVRGDITCQSRTYIKIEAWQNATTHVRVWVCNISIYKRCKPLTLTGKCVIPILIYEWAIHYIIYTPKWEFSDNVKDTECNLFRLLESETKGGTRISYAGAEPLYK